jgi:PPIC-type PPIASE domain
VFTVGDTVYTWADVGEFARKRGDWDRIEEQAAAGLAALEAFEPSQEAVEDAASSFRRTRNLLSGDELDAWLKSRGITVESWLDYIRRELARTEDAPTATTRAPDEVVWAQAMCSGALDDHARELARMLAVAPGLAYDELPGAYENFCISAASERAIDREIAASRLDWIRVRGQEGSFASDSVAAEVALCVREDGMALADAAAAAGVEVAEREIWLEDADPALISLLAAARPGELVGPSPTAVGIVLVHVREKLPADPADPDVRARAAAAVIEQAVDRAETDHVVWHEQL